ncbi:hypothetical protein RRG08_012878 [Elysia crispata]|uniref:Uncharacterized protein n=1 Tax=Elysia crispata TaxID=231223 RepID=A0AAE1E412_9GAST|nr:hypothetical protein RRG08_012878 [Elysia crispata]
MLDDHKVKQINQIMSEFSDFLTSLPDHTQQFNVKSVSVQMTLPGRNPSIALLLLKSLSKKVKKLLELDVIKPFIVHLLLP